MPRLTIDSNFSIQVATTVSGTLEVSVVHPHSTSSASVWIAKTDRKCIADVGSAIEISGVLTSLCESPSTSILSPASAAAEVVVMSLFSVQAR